MPSSTIILPAKTIIKTDTKVTLIKVEVVQSLLGNGYEVDGYVNPGYSGPID